MDHGSVDLRRRRLEDAPIVNQPPLNHGSWILKWQPRMAVGQARRRSLRPERLSGQLVQKLCCRPPSAVAHSLCRRSPCNIHAGRIPLGSLFTNALADNAFSDLTGGAANRDCRGARST
jgi:hypothetical protein